MKKQRNPHLISKNYKGIPIGFNLNLNRTAIKRIQDTREK
ncbi:hypothetical protein DDB_G0291876 [Dictyostelium discoideum AX4]|uniref:Putative uncharacterized protein DDB_G0291876 n=1 Tax=Dictyostelium discoideum TaxID=44689 RepID=Y8105_DICDI|nr:hypothetical protein DDB_G0291876 [Dictyostelium discoideum AX4]Q54E17.1 RecName: Full=Putative uncharacterized protein DDB_G0291876 [Dictyostelium discoideum]EAL61468.1 hypothetical protein DDB_G0291876 [Dictyostelium discoideum AX4]|eukprot:XP_629879.1 hypothetical protein DDB_G0291876 [Dictyostelium discoideum AX4]